MGDFIITHVVFGQANGPIPMQQHPPEWYPTRITIYLINLIFKYVQKNLLLIFETTVGSN